MNNLAPRLFVFFAMLITAVSGIGRPFKGRASKTDRQILSTPDIAWTSVDEAVLARTTERLKLVAEHLKAGHTSRASKATSGDMCLKPVQSYHGEDSLRFGLSKTAGSLGNSVVLGTLIIKGSVYPVMMTGETAKSAVLLYSLGFPLEALVQPV